MNNTIACFILNKSKTDGGSLVLNDFETWEDLRKAMEQKVDYTKEEIESKDFEYIILSEALDRVEGITIKDLYNALKVAGVLEAQNNYELMCAYIESKSLQEWLELIEDEGDSWTNYVELIRTPIKAFGEKLIKEYYPNLPNDILRCVDLEKYALNEISKRPDLDSTSYGIIKFY